MNKFILVQDAITSQSFGVVVFDDEEARVSAFSEKALDWQDWANTNKPGASALLKSLPPNLVASEARPINSLEIKRFEKGLSPEEFDWLNRQVGPGELEHIESTPGFGRRFATKSAQHKSAINVSHLSIENVDPFARQSIIEYKGLAGRSDIEHSEIVFLFKGARAVWDPDLGARGGWRCPPGTEYGGYITDRFGRGCGVGLIRRVGRALVNAGRGMDRLGTARDGRRLSRAAERAERGRRRGERASREVTEGTGDVARTLTGGERLRPVPASSTQGRRQRRNIPETTATPERIGEINDRLQDITRELDQLVDSPPTPEIDKRIDELQNESAALRLERDGGPAPARFQSGPDAPRRRRVVSEEAARPRRQRAKKPVRRPVSEGRRQGRIERAARRLLGDDESRREQENRYARVTDDALRRALYDNSATPLTDGVDPEAERQKTEERAEILREMGRRGIDIPEEYADESVQAGVRQRRKRRRQERAPGQNRRDAAAMALERAARRVLRQDDEQPRKSRVEELEDRIAEIERQIEVNQERPVQDERTVREWRRLQTELRQRRRQLERAREQADNVQETVQEVTPETDAPESVPEVAPEAPPTPRRPSRRDQPTPEEVDEAPVPDVEETPSEIPDEEVREVSAQIAEQSRQTVPSSQSRRNIRDNFRRGVLPTSAWWRVEEFAERVNADAEALERNFGKYYDDNDHLNERGLLINDLLLREQDRGDDLWVVRPEDSPDAQETSRPSSARERTRRSVERVTPRPASRPSSETSRNLDDVPIYWDDFTPTQNQAVMTAVYDEWLKQRERWGRRLGVDPWNVTPGQIAVWMHKQSPSTQQALWPEAEDFDALGLGRMDEALQSLRPAVRDRILKDAGIRGRYAGQQRRLVVDFPSAWERRTIDGEDFLFRDKFTSTPTRADAAAMAKSRVGVYGGQQVIFALESVDADGTVNRRWHVGNYDDLVKFADNIDNDDTLRDVLGDVVVYGKNDTEDLVSGDSLTSMKEPGEDAPDSLADEEKLYQALLRRNLIRPNEHITNARLNQNFRDLNFDIRNEKPIGQLTDEELDADMDELYRLLDARMGIDARLADDIDVGRSTARRLLRDEEPEGALPQSQMEVLYDAYGQEKNNRRTLNTVNQRAFANARSFDTLPEAIEVAQRVFDIDGERREIYKDSVSGKWLVINENFGAADGRNMFTNYVWNPSSVIEELENGGYLIRYGVYPSTSPSIQNVPDNVRRALNEIDDRQFRGSRPRIIGDPNAEKTELANNLRLVYGEVDNRTTAYGAFRQMFVSAPYNQDDERRLELFVMSPEIAEDVIEPLSGDLVDIAEVRNALIFGVNRAGDRISPSEMIQAREKHRALLELVDLLDDRMITTRRGLRARAVEYYLTRAEIQRPSVGRRFDFDDGPSANVPSILHPWIEDSEARRLRDMPEYHDPARIREWDARVNEEISDKVNQLDELASLRRYYEAVRDKHRERALDETLTDAERARQLRLADTAAEHVDLVQLEMDRPRILDETPREIREPQERSYSDLIDFYGFDFGDAEDYVRRRREDLQSDFGRYSFPTDTPDKDLTPDTYSEILAEWAIARFTFLSEVDTGVAAERAADQAIQWRGRIRRFIGEASERGIDVSLADAKRLNSLDEITEYVDRFAPGLREDVNRLALRADDRYMSMRPPSTEEELAQLIKERDFLRDAIVVSVNGNVRPGQSTWRRRKLNGVMNALISDYALIDDAIRNAPSRLRRGAERSVREDTRSVRSLSNLRKNSKYMEEARLFQTDVEPDLIESFQSLLAGRGALERADLVATNHRYRAKRREIDYAISKQMGIARSSDYPEDLRALALSKADNLRVERAALDFAYADYLSIQGKWQTDEEAEIIDELRNTRAFAIDEGKSALASELRSYMGGRRWQDVAQDTNRRGMLDNAINDISIDIARDLKAARSLLARDGIKDDEERGGELARLIGRLDEMFEARAALVQRRTQLDGGLYENPVTPSLADADFVPSRLRPQMGPRRLGKPEFRDVDDAAEHLRNGGDLADIPDGVVIDAVMKGARYIPDPDDIISSDEIDEDDDGNQRDFNNRRINGQVNLSDFRTIGLDGSAETDRFLFQVVKSDRQTAYSDDYEGLALWQVIKVTDKSTGDVWFMKASVYGHNDALMEMLGAQVSEELEIGIRPGDIRVGDAHYMRDGFNWGAGVRGTPDSPPEDGRWFMVRHVGQIDHGPGANPTTHSLDDWQDILWASLKGDEIEWEDMARIVALDIVINNEDRHGGNLQMVRQADGKVRLIPIDHGLAGGARGREFGQSAVDYLEEHADDVLRIGNAYNSILDLGQLGIVFPSDEQRKIFERQLVQSLERLRTRMDIIFSVSRLEANGIKLTAEEKEHMLFLKNLAQERVDRILESYVYIREISDRFEAKNP